MCINLSQVIAIYDFLNAVNIYNVGAFFTVRRLPPPGQISKVNAHGKVMEMSIREGYYIWVALNGSNKEFKL